MTTLLRTLRRTGLCLVVLSLTVAAVPPPVGAAAPAGVPEPVVVGAAEAELQAAVLAAEDRRLTEIRTVTSLARWQGQNWKTPYRLGTPAGYTLVLTPRASTYTFEDLLELAPQTFLRMSDGSYLLSEHIVVTPRATLRLAAPGGFTLRLASGPEGFATIVSLGGKLELVGEQGAAVNITSWDAAAGEPDEVRTDGRAYIRAIGGQFEADHVNITRLGFWAGRTGGLALTGTDRPNTGAIETAAQGDGGPLSLLDDVTWQPAGALGPDEASPNLEYTVPAVDYVSSRMSNVAVDHNAFGLFVSGANGVQVSDSVFSDNLHGGVLFHRYVTNGVISRSTSQRNAGDGFALDRATTGITINESTASENSGSGFSLDGRPLAEGPSAVGASLRSYGNNSVSHSSATGNARYGIELLGGFNVGLSNNVVDGHDMGIMVNGPSRRISVTGNTVRHSDRHGIALVNGVSGSTVTGNVVEGSTTGVYLRDSAGEVKGNTVQAARSHGVSLVGEVDGTNVSFNVLAGSGESALDVIRSGGEVSIDTNNLDGWHDTTPWIVLLKKLLKPMNALWTAIAILIIISAIRSRRGNGVIEHPYAHQMSHKGHLPIPQRQPALTRRPIPQGFVMELRDKDFVVVE